MSNRRMEPVPSNLEDGGSTTSSTIGLVEDQIDERRDIKYKLRRCCRCGKFRCLALLTFLLFVLSVTFLVLYILKKPSLPEPICDTMACVYISEDFDKQIDRSVDPCDDFYAYTCGGFLKNHHLGVNQSSQTGFSILNADNLEVLRVAIKNASVNYAQSTSIMKTVDIYDSCVDTTAIESRGKFPLESLITSYGGWRVTGSGLNSWTVAEKMGKVLRDLNVQTMLSIKVGTNPVDSSNNILQITGSSLGMPGSDFYITDSAENLKVRAAYQTYMKTVARLLGGGLATDTKMMGIYDFERQLAEATKDDFVSDDLIEALKEHHRSGRSINSLGLTLQTFCKESNFELPFILSVLNTAFLHQGISFSGDEPALYFKADTYFRNLARLNSEWNSDKIKDYIMWRVIDSYVTSMPSRFVEAKLKYSQAIRGVQPYTRWSQCIMGMMTSMDMTLGRLFVDSHFEESSKTTVEDMTSRVRQAFVDNLKDADWMDSNTKDKAKEKALAIKEDIGYPSYIKDNSKLDAKYSSLTVDSRFFENTMAVRKYLVQKNLGMLHQPVNKDMWMNGPAQVNGYYSPQQNRIVFLAGIIQSPFYTKNYPKYLNYGSIGMVVGHEITHGFDGSGRLFDKDGNFNNWWSTSSSINFANKAQCLINQYNKYEVFGKHIFGNQTINENIADNGGIKLAYDAYQAWVKDNAPEGRLPGLGLSVDQLFFVGFAQPWCSVYKKQAAYFQLKFDVHSFPKYRVIGPLSNFDKFADAFNCPSGSTMNPSSKCSVW